MQACVRRIAGNRSAGLGALDFEWNARLALDAAGACERGNPDGGRPCPDERPGGGACGGAGGEDVVDEQDVSSLHRGWIGDLEGATNILATLTGREAGLALGGAEPHECGRREGEMPGGMRFVERVEGVPRQDTGLVEAALAVLGAMQRHGYDEQLCGRIGSKLGNAGSKQFAEPAGSRMNAVVLERVDGGAHAAVVRAEGNSALERRRREAAGAAELRRCDAFDGRLVKIVAAEEANRAGVDRNLSPAGSANWNGGKLRQGGTAESTGSRKEGGTDCVEGTSKNARNGAPTRCLRKWTVDRQ